MSHLLPEHTSIFGDTMEGIPNPYLFHTHPYPTRFHGPIYVTPRFSLKFQPQSYIARGGPIARRRWLGTGTQGLGEGGPPLLAHATGSALLDAVVGAGIGYAVAKDKEDRLKWAIGGAAAGLLAGTLGLVGTLGAAIYVRKG